MVGAKKKPVFIPRIFVGGFEITRFIKNIDLELAFEDIATVQLTITAHPIRFNDDCIFIGEYPDDEFMAEMVRIKLKREGVMDEEGRGKDKA